MPRIPLLAAAMLCLTACGLRPLYGGGPGSPVVQALRSVQVSPIPVQSGWLMRN
jgi:LPS-assembly lipoprotein